MGKFLILINSIVKINNKGINCNYMEQLKVSRPGRLPAVWGTTKLREWSKITCNYLM